MLHPLLIRPLHSGVQLIEAGLGVFSALAAIAGAPNLQAQVAASSLHTVDNASQAQPGSPQASPSMDETTSTSTIKTNLQPALVVRGEEVQSAYGAPPALSRSRFSNLVNAYVLAPWTVYAAAIYEGDALHFNRPDHNYTAEIELGLPHRFGVAIENAVETPLFGTTHDSPRASVFAVFSCLFGGSERGEAEAPASTRNR